MILALILLASAIVDTVAVEPGKSVLLPVEVRDAAAAVECEFTLMSPGPGVRVSLVDAARPHGRGVLASTGYAQEGHLRFNARPGRYAVLVENGLDHQQGAEVFVRVALLPLSRHPRELSPARRAAVVAVSLIVFGLIAGYAFIKLRPSLALRKHQPPPA
ncbi:MAG: hypothetical protein ACM3ZB_16810 [bacterium]|jgi:hypothetical protein